MKSLKVSCIVPIYNMTNACKYLKRNLDSILSQTYKDYEIVVSDDSTDDMLKIWMEQQKYPIKYFKNKTGQGMARNTNNAIENARGDLIKILYQDDYFFNEDSLEDIIKHFTSSTEWLVTACAHEKDGIVDNPHQPFFSRSENTIGSPSVLTFRRTVTERFDPKFYWVLDLDFYRKLFDTYGKPKILNKINVIIGLGDHQSTHLLSDQRKAIEEAQMR